MIIRSSHTTASGSKRSIRCQKETTMLIIYTHDVILPKNHDPNLYLHTEIPDDQAAIHLL